MMIYDVNPVANLISKKFSTKRRAFIVVSSFLSVMFYYLFICAIKKLFIFHLITISMLLSITELCYLNIMYLFNDYNIYIYIYNIH